MAATDPFSPTVYQGREGTGAAFVLQGNKAADIFHSRLAQMEQQRRLEEYQRQKALQAQNALIDKNLSQLTVPKDYWAPHDKYFLNQTDALRKEAELIKSQGKNPFTDTEWLSKRDALLADAKYSGQLSKQLEEVRKQIAANPDKFSPESIQQALTYFDPNKPLSEFRKENSLPPGLKLRYDESDILKGIKPGQIVNSDGDVKTTGVDRKGIIDQIRTRLESPAGEFVLQNKYGVNPGIGLFGEPDKNGLYPTDDTSIANIANEILQTPGAVNELRGIGITAETPEEIQAQLSGLIKQQNTGVNKAIKSMADAVEGQGRKGTERVNTNFSRRMQEANLALRREANARAERNQEEKYDPVFVMVNSNSYVPVVKKGGKVENEKGASLFSISLPQSSNTSIVVSPSRVIKTNNEGAGTSEKNTGSFSFKPSGVKLVPVIKGAKDNFNGVELSLRQLEEIIAGKHPSLKIQNIDFAPMVPGVKVSKNKDNETVEESVSIPYDAVRGNKNFKASGFDKTLDNFKEMLASPEFKNMSASDRLNFLKSQFNLQ